MNGISSVCLVISLSIVTYAVNGNIQLPSYVQICYRDDPSFASCIKKNIENLVPLFKDGSKDFDIAPLDPLEVEEVTFRYKSSVMGGELTFRKVSISGIQNLKVVDVRPRPIEPNKLLIEADLFFPRLVFRANYSLNGNVLSASSKINGRSHILLDRVSVTFSMDSNVNRRDNKDYLVVKSLIWKNFGKGIENLQMINDDVVEGHPVLNGVVIGLMKTAWKPLLNQMLPPLQKSSSHILTNMSVKPLSMYPYDVFFPRREYSGL